MNEESIIKLNVIRGEAALIQDLSDDLKEITEGKVDWIYRYCDKEKIAKAIYDDFILYNKRQTSYITGGKWDEANTADDAIKYIFSNDLRYEGLLSYTQAFQVLATLLEEFDLNKKSYSEKVANSLIAKILAHITKDGGYTFDTTPYLHNSKSFRDGEHAYIDSLTWTLSAMLSFFRLYISGKLAVSDETLDQAINIYRYSVKYLIDSFVDNTTTQKKFKKGWNFTKMSNQELPSLYFTFAVSEVMIDIFDTFEDVIRTADIYLLAKQIDNTMQGKDSAEAIESKKEQVRINYEEYEKALNSGSEKSRREIDLFKRINDGYEVYDDNSPYAILESLVKDAAQNIWSIVKDSVSNTFFSSDLESAITEKAIEQSYSNDALFNSIFIINTIINAGLDEDVEDVINYFTVNGSDEYYSAIEDYDYIREALRLAYDNTWQFYAQLKKNNKEYKVSEYILSFDESFKGSHISAIATELRKARIRVFSLMPLLVKTKTTIGEFVIGYPQYDMQIYLEAILQNRYKSVTQSRTVWIWEKDGYSTSSNYYFISALGDFYNYYEKYEQQVIRNAANNANTKKKIQEEARQDYLLQLEAKGGKIFELNKQLEQKNAEIRALEEKYAALEADTADFRRDPLTYGITLHIQRVMQEKILEVLTADVVGQLLTNLSTGLQDDAIARVQRKAAQATDLRQDPTAPSPWYDKSDDTAGSSTALEKGISDMGRSLFSERLLEMLVVDRAKINRTVSDPQSALEPPLDTLAEDIKKAVRLYVQPIVKQQSSEYVSTEGFKGIHAVLDKHKAEAKK